MENERTQKLFTHQSDKAETKGPLHFCIITLQKLEIGPQFKYTYISFVSYSICVKLYINSQSSILEYNTYFIFRVVVVPQKGCLVYTNILPWFVYLSLVSTLRLILDLHTQVQLTLSPLIRDQPSMDPHTLAQRIPVLRMPFPLMYLPISHQCRRIQALLMYLIPKPITLPTPVQLTSDLHIQDLLFVKLTTLLFQIYVTAAIPRSL